MMGRTIRVTGTSEVVAQLRAISAATSGLVLQTAVLAGALIIQNDAKRRAPFLTGNLRRSIHTEPGLSSPTSAEATVGTDVEYAPYQEFGTSKMAAQPYLRPAADENDDVIESAVTRVIDAAIAGASL